MENLGGTLMRNSGRLLDDLGLKGKCVFHYDDIQARYIGMHDSYSH